MQSAETVLGVLRERGRRGLPCDELYRQLFNPQLYLLAYGRIYGGAPATRPAGGFGAGELLVGLASAQLAGEDFLVGLDRRCDDVAGQEISPVAGLSSTTAAGLARRFADPQWTAVETGVARITERVFELLPVKRRARWLAR